MYWHLWKVISYLWERDLLSYFMDTAAQIFGLVEGMT